MQPAPVSMATKLLANDKVNDITKFTYMTGSSRILYRILSKQPILDLRHLTLDIYHNSKSILTRHLEYAVISVKLLRV